MSHEIPVVCLVSKRRKALQELDLIACLETSH